jgi:hypothetical protein
MVQRRISDLTQLVRTGARELPSNATRVWGRARELASSTRTRAATWIANRVGREEPDPDLKTMTKDELMALAQEQDISGRSSMTKAQLVTALRKARGN